MEQGANLRHGKLFLLGVKEEIAHRAAHEDPNPLVQGGDKWVSGRHTSTF